MTVRCHAAKNRSNGSNRDLVSTHEGRRVPGDEGVLVGQLALTSPDPVVAEEAVQEDDRPPTALALVGNAESTGFDESHHGTRHRVTRQSRINTWPVSDEPEPSRGLHGRLDLQRGITAPSGMVVSEFDHGRLASRLKYFVDPVYSVTTTQEGRSPARIFNSPLFAAATLALLEKRRVIASMENQPDNTRGRRVENSPPPSADYGLMFWFKWKRLSGSYFRLTSTSLM